MKIWDSDVVWLDAGGMDADKPGTIVSVAKDSFDVACGNGILRINELQLEGKNGWTQKAFCLETSGRQECALAISKCLSTDRKGDVYAVFWLLF